MFGRKKKVIPPVKYNKETQQAVIKCSICTGEQVAGFKDIQSGHFTEVMLIRSEKDLESFKDMYDLQKIIKEY